MDLEEIRNKLREYGVEKIKFNEPHFTNRLVLREGNKSEVIDNLMNPDKLVHYDSSGEVYSLYFKISNKRTMKLPVIFGENLYILTYIMRYRKWQNMVR